MTEVVLSGKACTVNPLKTSPALGGALAFLGIEGCLPLFHGSQGCTAFALVLMVRHFREAIPLQTTAMSELSTILGGSDNIEQAIGNILERARPRVIGLCTTALTETRGEDMVADLRQMRAAHPDWAGLHIVFASTPDYGGSLEEGWAAAVAAIVETMVPEGDGTRALRQVTLLPGSHLTAADVEELREIVEACGLQAIVLPDLSRSLDGHVPDRHVPTSLGGATVEEIEAAGRSVLCIALGEQMRAAAEALQRRAGVPYRLLDRAIGLESTDALVAALLEVPGAAVSARLKRDRSRLQDAMLDGHFFFEGRKIAIAAEADLLLSLASFCTGLGAIVAAAVAPANSPALATVPAARVVVGDLDDLERGAAGCDLLFASSHGRGASDRLEVPLVRVGFPVFDRLGAAQRLSVGYRGARQLVVEIANVLMEHGAHADRPDAVTDDSHFEHEQRGERHAQAQAG